MLLRGVDAPSQGQGSTWGQSIDATPLYSATHNEQHLGFCQMQEPTCCSSVAPGPNPLWLVTCLGVYVCLGPRSLRTCSPEIRTLNVIACECDEPCNLLVECGTACPTDAPLDSVCEHGTTPDLLRGCIEWAEKGYFWQAQCRVGKRNSDTLDVISSDHAPYR